MCKPRTVQFVTRRQQKYKTEIDVLKKNAKALAGIKQEGKVIKKHMESLKEEIRKIPCENLNIIQRIKYIEDDFEKDFR